jgi:hypothetical protein
MNSPAHAEQHAAPHWNANQAEGDANHHFEAGAHGAEEARNGGGETANWLCQQRCCEHQRHRITVVFTACRCYKAL